MKKLRDGLLYGLGMQITDTIAVLLLYCTKPGKKFIKKIYDETMKMFE